MTLSHTACDVTWPHSPPTLIESLHVWEETGAQRRSRHIPQPGTTEPRQYISQPPDLRLQTPFSCQRYIQAEDRSTSPVVTWSLYPNKQLRLCGGSESGIGCQRTSSYTRVSVGGCSWFPAIHTSYEAAVFNVHISMDTESVQVLCSLKWTSNWPKEGQ